MNEKERQNLLFFSVDLVHIELLTENSEAAHRERSKTRENRFQLLVGRSPQRGAGQ